MSKYHDICPFCDADLHDYATGGSRMWGHSVMELDMTVAWSCPDCKAYWCRECGVEQEKPDSYHKMSCYIGERLHRLAERKKA